jgi:K+-transporting ATPase KdpF subunit
VLEMIAHGFDLARGTAGLLRWLLLAHPPVHGFARGGVAVDWTMWLAALIAVCLGYFLLVALLKPEWFA